MPSAVCLTSPQYCSAQFLACFDVLPIQMVREVV